MILKNEIKKKAKNENYLYLQCRVGGSKRLLDARREFWEKLFCEVLAPAEPQFLECPPYFTVPSLHQIAVPEQFLETCLSRLPSSLSPRSVVSIKQFHCSLHDRVVSGSQTGPVSAHVMEQQRALGLNTVTGSSTGSFTPPPISLPDIIPPAQLFRDTERIKPGKESGVLAGN